MSEKEKTELSSEWIVACSVLQRDFLNQIFSLKKLPFKLF